MSGFREQLSGGDPRSLHGVFDVVREVLAKPARTDELVALIFDHDEVIRMRAADALEKVAAAKPEAVAPFAEQLLTDAADIKQPSIQWHLAQIFTEIKLTTGQARRAATILERNLRGTTDWIVQNLTLEALAYFTIHGVVPTERFRGLLKLYRNNEHASVARRATKLLAQFGAA